MLALEEQISHEAHSFYSQFGSLEVTLYILFIKQNVRHLQTNLQGRKTSMEVLL